MKFLTLVSSLLVVSVVIAEPPNLRKIFAQYSAELYSEVKKSNTGSFVICPPSIQTGLGLIYSAAKGESAKQISTSLHFPENSNEFQDVIAKISDTLQTPETGDYISNSANKVYIANTLKINGKYKDILVKNYKADVENVDFNNKEQAASKINRWIEEKTHDKIKDMIKEDQLDDVRAALINAIYFEGKWRYEFNSELTKPNPFYVDSKTVKDLATMNMAGHFKYYESPTLRAQFLELPYKGENVTMTFVLPLDKFGLSALESNIEQTISEPTFKEERVIMTIPKFKVETSVDLVPVLTQLGIEDIFSGKADLTGMTEDGEHLKIGAALQNAVIEVDEKGTVATAAFVGFAVPMSAMYVPPPTYYFTADHPFLYYIKVNDTVMFIGRYST